MNHDKDIIIRGSNETPVDVKSPPRPYQLELYEEAIKDKENNSLIILPTGTGKTLIACMILKKMLELNPGKKCAFVVDRLPLVFQQKSVLEAQIEGVTIDTLYGGQAQVTRQNALKAQIIVIIGESFRLELTAGSLNIEDFSLIVFDEVHHLVNNHPFRRIMLDFYKIVPEEKQPKIIGLTACPTMKREKTAFKFAIRALMESCARSPPSEYQDHQKHRCVPARFLVPSRELESLVKQKSSPYTRYIPFYLDRTKLFSINHKIEGLIEQCFSSPQLRELAHQFDKSQTAYHPAFANAMKGFSKKQLDEKDQVLFGQIQTNVESLNSYINFGLTKDIHPLVDYLVKAEEKGNYDIVAKLEKSLQCLTIGNGINYYDQDDGDDDDEIILSLRKEKSKYEALLELLAKNPDKKMILFVILRSTAEILTNFLKRDNFQVDKIVGRSEMTPSQQKEKITKFKDNEINILVATNVVEEGFDVPECDLVVIFDGVQTVCSMIQARGRARKRESEFVYFRLETDTKEYFKKFAQDETSIDEYIEEIKNNPNPEQELKKTPYQLLNEIVQRQERVGEKEHQKPYEFTRRGPPHKPTFTLDMKVAVVSALLEVSESKHIVCRVEASSIKDAENEAALIILNKLEELRIAKMIMDRESTKLNPSRLSFLAIEANPQSKNNTTPKQGQKTPTQIWNETVQKKKIRDFRECVEEVYKDEKTKMFLCTYRFGSNVICSELTPNKNAARHDASVRALQLFE